MSDVICFVIVKKNHIETLGNKYRIVFKSASVNDVNDYCAANEGCGVLHEDTETGMIYVCENEAMGGKK